jgi:hypothetical protein
LLAGRIFSVLAGACQFGTAWVGFRLVHNREALASGRLGRFPGHLLLLKIDQQ